MKTETGNINALNEMKSERKGWFIGNFIEEESPRYSENCEIKWAIHKQGTKKTSSGGDTSAKTRTVVILLSGKWLTRFLDDGQEVVLAQSGDYLLYEDRLHENEALEESHVIVVRWKV